MAAKDTKMGKKNVKNKASAAAAAAAIRGKAAVPNQPQNKGSGKNIFGGMMLTVAVGLAAACASLFLELQEAKVRTF